MPIYSAVLVLLMIKAVDCDTWSTCWFPSKEYLRKLNTTRAMAQEMLENNQNSALQRAIDLIMEPASKTTLSSLNNVLR